jgi:hypothetical protein
MYLGKDTQTTFNKYIWFPIYNQQTPYILQAFFSLFQSEEDLVFKR